MISVEGLLFSQSNRRISAITPTIVISERHSDTSEITNHPIEDGAAISDHAYANPAEVVMEMGFSGGGSVLDSFDTTQYGIEVGTSPQDIYKKILELRDSFKPFTVSTGKRLYKNMLFKSIDVETDSDTELILSITITLREVFITKPNGVTWAPAERHKFGNETTGVIDRGLVQGREISNKTLLLEGKEWLLK